MFVEGYFTCYGAVQAPSPKPLRLTQAPLKPPVYGQRPPQTTSQQKELPGLKKPPPVYSPPPISRDPPPENTPSTAPGASKKPPQASRAPAKRTSPQWPGSANNRSTAR